MFTLTPTAALTLDQLRQQQQIPAGYGLRVSGRSTPDGQLGLQIGFAEEPAATDTVAEQHGTKVFVAEEVVEPLAEVALDVAPTGDGAAAPELVLRPQEPGEG